MLDLREELGAIDIYLLDQILRGRIDASMKVFDAGCGRGRNLAWFLRSGSEVFAVDQDAQAISQVQSLAKRLAPGFPLSNLRAEPIESHSFPDAWADVVISSAVLHFARDDEQFNAMLRSSWRALRPGGLFFCRLASTIGMEDRFERLTGRRFLLPDGSERYLVDEAMLMELCAILGGTLLDPIKTTVVQDQRCMSTWVVRKE